MQRVREFSVQIKTEYDDFIEIHHQTRLMPTDGYAIHFPAKEMTAMRILFLKCDTDPNFGYSEPSITHLKAYYDDTTQQ